MGSTSAAAEARPIDATDGSGAHQAGISEQRTQTGVVQTSAAFSAPLARQSASLGSLDFLKLLESGSHGECIKLVTQFTSVLKLECRKPGICTGMLPIAACKAFGVGYGSLRLHSSASRSRNRNAAYCKRQ